MDRIEKEQLKEIIEFIEQLNITDGIYTTYDKSLMNNCKYVIINMLKAKYEQNNNA